MSAITSWFEVKIRVDKDRTTSDGKKVEGGRVISRHYEVKTKNHAEDRAKAERIGRVVSIKKVRQGDVIGDPGKFKKLLALVERPRSVAELEAEDRVKRDVIVQNATLDDIVFGKGHREKVKDKRNEKLEWDRLHKHQQTLSEIIKE